MTWNNFNRLNSTLTRREFLKLASILPLLPLVGKSIRSTDRRISGSQITPNVIVILYDALSAFNLSLYGYKRQTSPNLDAFAQRATVYHNHHTAANFTTPSTASLFTSTYPWTHRAFELNSLISPEISPYNLFQQLGGIFNQVVFTQNLFADTLLYQFEDFIDRHERLDSFSLVGHTFYNRFFRKDAIAGLKSYDQFLFKREQAHGSLLLSILNDLEVLFKNRIKSEQLADLHPNGLPRMANTDVYFLNEQVNQGVMGILSELVEPSFVYLHLIPPHEPYLPTSQYIGLFDDGWQPTPKKHHRMAPGVTEERLNERRQDYDEFIANLDADFGRLMTHLEATGLMDNSYIIVTSDHGELFERGIHGHSTPVLFEPVIRVPLIVSEPGQRQRKDIHALTSNVDLLPTFIKLGGSQVPDWCEGQVLPGLGGEENSNRSIFVVEAKKSHAHSPLKKATTAIIKGQYKLVHYFGYRYYKDNYELYDLKEDPEELHNLYPSHPVARELQAELEQRRAQAERPYTEG